MPDRKVPVNLICGPLGIGKTTTILRYLQRSGSAQFTAVLVNDFGPVGLDAAIIEGDLAHALRANTSIKMLPGGCVCCTSAASFISSIHQLRTLPRLDRIIIEPSGLALVGDMVDVVSSVADKYNLEVLPVITLVEPRLLDRAGFLLAPYYIRMVEAADVLVANRCDLASAAQIARFDEWSAALFPPKLRIYKTTQGELPQEAFDLTFAGPRYSSAPAAIREPHTRGQHAGGCVFEANKEFDPDAVDTLLRGFALKGIVGNEVLRLKAILHTSDGWKLYEIAGTESYCRPTDYRRDSRIDWITQGVPLLDEAIKEMFSACASD